MDYKYHSNDVSLWMENSHDPLDRHSVGQCRKIQNPMYFATKGQTSEQCHNAHKYLSIIFHCCANNVEYLTFAVILEHRSLHSPDGPTLFTKLSQVALLG